MDNVPVSSAAAAAGGYDLNLNSSQLVAAHQYMMSQAAAAGGDGSVGFVPGSASGMQHMSMSMAAGKNGSRCYSQIIGGFCLQLTHRVNEAVSLYVRFGSSHARLKLRCCLCRFYACSSLASAANTAAGFTAAAAAAASSALFLPLQPRHASEMLPLNGTTMHASALAASALSYRLSCRFPPLLLLSLLLQPCQLPPR
jgi:hypothetical protein